MKLKLEKGNVQLVAENYADKLYIFDFIKTAETNKTDNFIEVHFKYSEDRCYVDRPQGGGYLEPSRIVETLYEAEEDETHNKVAIEEITELNILT